MKKAIMTCLLGISALTCGTSSFADSSNGLQDTNGNTLKTGKAYCIRPISIEPIVNITVGNEGYVHLSDNDVDCEYAYQLIGNNRVNNRAVIAGETVRFEEVKKESDGTYRKTNNFLKVNRIDERIRSTPNEYVRIPYHRDFPAAYKSYEFSNFRLESTNQNNSALQIKYRKADKTYVWKTPYTIEGGEQWIQIQDQNTSTGITTFEFEPVQ